MDVAEQCAAWARLFVGHEHASDEIDRPDLLDRASLDYSLASLHAVDRYLHALHELGAGIDDARLAPTVTRGGAYLGEVIRRGARDDGRHVYDRFRWVSPTSDALPDELRRHLGPPDLATSVVLVQDPALGGPAPSAVCLPLGKVAKRIAHGLADSVHFFAEATLRGAIAMGVATPGAAARIELLKDLLGRPRGRTEE